MSSPINTSDLSVCHLHTVDNDDSHSDADGGGGGHAIISTAEQWYRPRGIGIGLEGSG